MLRREALFKTNKGLDVSEPLLCSVEMAGTTRDLPSSVSMPNFSVVPAEYPSHFLPVEVQRKQAGFSSPHFFLLILHYVSLSKKVLIQLRSQEGNEHMTYRQATSSHLFVRSTLSPLGHHTRVEI